MDDEVDRSTIEWQFWGGAIIISDAAALLSCMHLNF